MELEEYEKVGTVKVTNPIRKDTSKPRNSEFVEFPKTNKSSNPWSARQI